jgi:segregation and condensation protein A
VTPAAPDPQGATLVVHLDGYDGPIDLLLELAQAQQVDLARLSLRALIDQYLAAVDAHREVATLAARSEWLIAASRLVLLKSRLLVQGEDEAAPPEADRLREDLVRAAQRQHARALAHWLEARPQLGRDIFARGQPDAPRPAGSQGDVLDLLLACFDLFAPPGRVAPPLRYVPPVFDVCSLAEALQHLEARLRAHPQGGPWRLLVPSPAPDRSALRRRSTVASTFLAGLELAKQGRVVLRQQENFGALQVRLNVNRCVPATVSAQRRVQSSDFSNGMG